jgi:hypothetical protein
MSPSRAESSPQSWEKSPTAGRQRLDLSSKGATFTTLLSGTAIAHSHAAITMSFAANVAEGIMNRIACTLSLAFTLSVATLTGQSPQTPAADVDVLATVRITGTVIAGGTPLSPGTYDVRLTEQRPTPVAGQSRDAQRWVEFVADGKVIAREIAEVLQDDDLPGVGASSQPVRSGVRVELLKGGEFLRISVKRDRARYLIYLPVAP